MTLRHARPLGGNLLLPLEVPPARPSAPPAPKGFAEGDWVRLDCLPPLTGRVVRVEEEKRRVKVSTAEYGEGWWPFRDVWGR